MLARKALEAGLGASDEIDAFLARANFAGLTEISIESGLAPSRRDSGPLRTWNPRPATTDSSAPSSVR